MRIATGFIEKKRSVELTLKCDRCGDVVSVLDNVTLAEWVCCHKIFTNHAHMPPRVLPDLAEGVSEVIPVLDELHVCGKCWHLVEAQVQPTKPPPAPLVVERALACRHGFHTRGLCPDCVTTKVNPYPLDTPLGALVNRLQRSGVAVDLERINFDRDYYEAMQAKSNNGRAT